MKKIVWTGYIRLPGRLAVAHALVKFGPAENMADRIWEKYDRLDLKRKDEVSYILNALQDPNFDKRLLEVLNIVEDHQLMVRALEVLVIGGSEKVLPALRSKVEEWSEKSTATGNNPNPDAPTIYYAPLRIKAEAAILAIEERSG